MQKAGKDSKIYFPPSESRGGWRYLKSPDELVSIAGMDPRKLSIVETYQNFFFGNESWSIVIIRNGHLAQEFYSANVLQPTMFDIWSCTKSFTGMSFGCLFDESNQGRVPSGEKIDLNTKAYQYIPEGVPLSDPRKKDITIGHLLSMTSGIPGEKEGIIAVPTTTDNGTFEYILGRCPSRYGQWVDKLIAEPGTAWDYSDPAYAHLSMIFANVMKCEMRDYAKEHIFDPIGIGNLYWELQGGRGFIGPHTNAHTGLHISARDMARIGYLLLHKGNWDGKQIIPRWWVELAKSPSQDINKNYGYGIWTNATGTKYPNIPRDSFALSGYRNNRCYIIPSLDLIVARVGSGPSSWNEGLLIEGIVESIR